MVVRHRPRVGAPPPKLAPPWVGGGPPPTLAPPPGGFVPRIEKGIGEGAIAIIRGGTKFAEVLSRDVL